MIIKGNARAGAANLAKHLSNARDNDRIEVTDIRGVLAFDMHGALMDMEAVASGSRCTEHLYSCSINPTQPMTRAQYDHAIERIEKKLGLADQPRLVVFHWKESEHTGESREHCHVVWSRIREVEKRDRAGNVRTELQAIPLPFDRQRLREVAQVLARDFGHALPEGLQKDRGAERFKEAFQVATLAEQAQEKRSGLDPAERKAEITAAYRAADSGTAFINALEERGYYLARGDQRGFVIVDQALEVHALSRQIEGARSKEIAAKLAPLTPEQLPSVDQARQLVAQRQVARADHAQAYSAARPSLEAQEARHKELLASQKAALKAVRAVHVAAWKDAKAREEEALEQAAKRIKDRYRPEWKKLFWRQGQEARAFEAAKDTTVGRLRYYLHSLKTNKLHDDARGILANAFNFIIRGHGDPTKMEKAHERERLKLGRQQGRETRRDQREIATEWKAHRADIKSWYEQDRDTLKAQQALARLESEKALEQARLLARARGAVDQSERSRKQETERTRTVSKRTDQAHETPARPRDDWIKSAVPADSLKKAQEAARKDAQRRKEQARTREPRGPRGPYDGGRTR